jgi:D-aspartate ligase
MHNSTTASTTLVRKRQGEHAPVPAVIMGLDYTVGLQTSRILHKHGVPVIGLAKNPDKFFCKTRCVQRVIQADMDDESTLSALENLAGSLHQKAVLCPCTNEAVLTVSRFRSRLDPYFLIALPDDQTINALADKAKVEASALQAGLKVPQTWVLSSRAEAEAAAGELTFPGIIKPSIKTFEWWQYCSEKVVQVNNAEELLEFYDLAGQSVPQLILQEWVVGSDAEMYSYYSYIGRDGQILAETVTQKTRQYPPYTGVGCLCVQVEEPRVSEPAKRLLAETGYHGLSSIQFKRHALTDEFYFIEANVGRPALNMPVAENCGVEMQYTMYCDTADLPLPVERSITRPGKKWILWRTDLRSAWHYYKLGELSIIDWLRSVSGNPYRAEISPSDPMPTIHWIWSLIKKRLFPRTSS